MKFYQKYKCIAVMIIVVCLLFVFTGCGRAAEVTATPDSVKASSSLSSSETSKTEIIDNSAASSEPEPSSSKAEPVSSSAPFQTIIENSDPPTSSEPPATGDTRDSTARVLVPSADGITVLGNSLVEIDASNVAEGYVMVRYLGSNSNVKLQLTRDSGTTYTYNLNTSGNYETFPLAGGSGSYTLNVFENVSGNQYALAYGESFQADLKSSLLPFLYPNQYVNFSSGSSTVTLGTELARTANSDLKVVENVYNYVINNITYDFDKAEKASSGYLPDVDTIIKNGKGICFDYAAVMATMLRTQRIPTKLVVGYSGKVYHAWVSVYITDVGWVNGIIYFDGTSWVRMDPTFASSAKSSSQIMDYIGNGSNYNALYVY
ncbi:transglutaminase superfamily protein [Hydrogenoanaerobacterium saccharovorans]|uniref:Transglutaminase-like superfamily protein n=1 Tax=Hydrogenoanaerobacterium saccharovorans TaxID=474960 RepID=A0A1H8DVB9_9FIRM|nr:transglutaminase-like domain-containing protein [Hydrogenoanaerobacterium saccharovorans]RPF42413.1 transglutaminase superfamily protein [Hydrogenoanaerobacterium saccharovorans]SEN11153.1 Transglutaminase-like superfamily protein [Hydrogenoanaerobacterium saccharovorans]